MKQPIKLAKRVDDNLLWYIFHDNNHLDNGFADIAVKTHFFVYQPKEMSTENTTYGLHETLTTDN